MLGIIFLCSAIATLNLIPFIWESLISIEFIAFLLGVTISGYGMLFSAFLVAEYNLEGMNAFKMSFEGVKKNFFGLLGINFAKMIMMFGGMMAVPAHF